MHKSRIPLRVISLGCAVLALLLGSGCVTVSPNMYAGLISYQPEPSKTRIEANVMLHVTHTLTPGMRAQWKKWMNSDQNIDNYSQAVVNVLANDIVQSGIFTQVAPSVPLPDFIVNLTCEERMDPEGKVVLNLEVLNPARHSISNHTREIRMGTTLKDYNLKAALPKLMADLKADMLADFAVLYQQRQQKAAEAQVAAFAQATLSDLLTSADPNVTTARGRNRAIIAAKNQQLPAMLRANKTAELSDFVVKIEQTILDLNHESEVAKDRAQQAAANNADPQQTEEIRGLGISYRERIELLKPILAALKEEIANRGR